MQWNNIYPEWRDKLHISPVEDLSELLLISLKDATKNGESETIGQCILPLSKLLDQQAHTFWINLEPPSGMFTKFYSLILYLIICVMCTDRVSYFISILETRKSARNRVKLPANCAVRIEAKLTYCRRVLLQQKFDLISMRLREMKMTGAFELPIATSRFSTEDIVREAHRVRCAGGGRSLRIDKSKGLSSPISEDGRRTPRSERSGWEETSGSGAQTLSSKHKAIKEQLYTVRGVYHLSRESQPPIEIPRTPKRPGSGPRLKQDSPASTPGRCSNTANTSSSRVNSKLSDVGQEVRISFSTTCNTSAAANSLSTSSSNSTTRSDMGSVTSKKTVVKSIQCAVTPPSKEKKITSHDEQETVPRSDLPSPDLSIFKSSRARLALKKSNRISTVKMKPSSAFGATCWTAPSYPINAAAHGSPL
jgi:C2 domain